MNTQDLSPLGWTGWILLKETDILYAENYKTLIKEINDAINRLRDVSYS